MCSRYSDYPDGDKIWFARVTDLLGFSDVNFLIKNHEILLLKNVDKGKNDFPIEPFKLLFFHSNY